MDAPITCHSMDDTPPRTTDSIAGLQERENEYNENNPFNVTETSSSSNTTNTNNCTKLLKLENTFGKLTTIPRDSITIDLLILAQNAKSLLFCPLKENKFEALLSTLADQTPDTLYSITVSPNHESTNSSSTPSLSSRVRGQHPLRNAYTELEHQPSFMDRNESTESSLIM